MELADLSKWFFFFSFCYVVIIRDLVFPPRPQQTYHIYIFFSLNCLFPYYGNYLLLMICKKNFPCLLFLQRN